ncbi:MAG: hypothetical protein LKM31_05690 [Sphingobium sp.]|nr:hypothetical protein [Sphingobium sp.]
MAAAGSSWAATTSAKSGDPNAAQTIDTAGLINRDLSQREFVATYGNRLDAVTREQKALKDASIPREEIEAQLAALKAENQAMRVDGQAAIDAISAENADLKTRLAASPHLGSPERVPPPAYGPQAGGYDARGRTAPSTLGGAPVGAGASCYARARRSEADELHVGQAGANGLKVWRPETPPVVIEDSPDLPAAQFLCARRASSSASMHRPASPARPIRFRWSCGSPAQRDRSCRTARF